MPHNIDRVGEAAPDRRRTRAERRPQRRSETNNSCSADGRNSNCGDGDDSATVCVMAPNASRKQSPQQRHVRRSTLRPRRVTFGKCPGEVTVRVAIIPNRQSYTAEEKQLAWISSQEHQRTIDHCKSIVRSTFRNAPVQPRQLTRSVLSTTDPSHQKGSVDYRRIQDVKEDTRGLEYMTPDGFHIINAKSKQTVLAVLDEQKRLRQSLCSDDNRKSRCIANTISSTGTSVNSTSLPDYRYSDSAAERIADALSCTVSRVSRHRHRIAQLAAMKDAQAVYGTHSSRARLTTNTVGAEHNPRHLTVRRSRSGGSLACMLREFRTDGDRKDETVSGTTRASDSSDIACHRAGLHSNSVNVWEQARTFNFVGGTRDSTRSRKDHSVATAAAKSDDIVCETPDLFGPVTTHVIARTSHELRKPVLHYSVSLDSVAAARRRGRQPRRRVGLRRTDNAAQSAVFGPKAIDSDSRRSSTSTAASTLSESSEASLSVCAS